MDFVEAYGQEHKVPIIAIHSAGYYSYFRINLPGTFPIVDTHPDSTATTDLRLLTPWEELSKFAANLTDNIDALSAHEHGHIPYVALLLYYLEKWKQTHGNLPSTYKEKTAFRDTVAAGARTNNSEGGEENFDEAVAAVLKTISSPSLSTSVKEVFDYAPSKVCRKRLYFGTVADLLQMESKLSFWIIADAIKQFYKKQNALPLPGSVPDMKAQSTVYVQLQNIYKAKARQDVAEVLETVRAHPEGKDIDVAEVEAFCKNAAFIKLIHGTKSYEASPAKIKALAGMYCHLHMP
jgi:amyloid beta precursor protein binding protein 1